MRMRTGVVAVVALAVPVLVARGFAGQAGSGCPPGAAGLGCEAKAAQKQACACDGTPVPGCRKATKGGWLRIRKRLAKLTKAERRGDRAKIPAHLAKIDPLLANVRRKVEKLIDRHGGGDACKRAAAELLAAFGARVDDTFDPTSAGATTTTVPGGGSLQGSGVIGLFDPTEITFDVSFTQRVDVFGVYVPGRSIVGSLPTGVATCVTSTWTTEGDALTPDNYYECTGSLGPGVHATGNLRLSPPPASGMAIHLYAFRAGARFGPFTLGSSF